ncbi:beta-glucosidase family protein [Arthrobacter sp. UC242_113]|uniref:beta-glucosidase family protein n=1 Tax=Arthrobacter sp. UC242_113 TaxID=3374550 RepID=UPI00375687B1
MPDIDLSAMTLEQKASLLTGGGFWSTAAIPEFGVGEFILTDGPHGVRRQIQGTDHLGVYHSEPATCFPPAVAVGSSWSKDVAAAMGSALAVESRASGVDVLLGPGVNIKRSPLGGRNFEYYSEDPLLSGALGTAYVNALQAGGVGASLKHFAANDQETERMVISSDVDERTLREIHLAAFEHIVKEANPATVMCSYNKINGVYASENRWLLTDVLRREWGYAGPVVSDWGAVRDRVASLRAGLDLAMPGTGPRAKQAIVDAVAAGHLEEGEVDAAAQRVLSLSVYSADTPASAFDVDAHHKLAVDLAAECAVLLKNDNSVLPLKAGMDILVTGDFAVEPRFQGGGSSHVNATRFDGPLDFLKAKAEAHGGRIRFTPGLASHGEGADARPGAAELAAGCDVALIFAGLPETDESEGFDRRHIDLPEPQVRLIRQVAVVAPRTVVVLSNGGVVSLEGWHDDVDAILEGFLLGQGGSEAIADLLFGDKVPSGHLAESIPLRLKDVPTHLNFPGEQGHVRYGEGVMVGYRYYETADVPVRYPFGHGLSYTTFETRNLQVVATGRGGASVRVTVTNTGAYAGKHVVQVYVSTQSGPVLRPTRELKAFAKVHLEAGESRTVELVLDRRAFAYWDIVRSNWSVAPGQYTVQIGHSSSDIVAERTLTLDGDDEAPPISLQSSVGDWLAHPTAGPEVKDRVTMVIAQSGQDIAEDSDQMRMITSMPMIQMLGLMGGAIDSDWLMSLLVNPQSPADTPSAPAAADPVGIR